MRFQTWIGLFNAGILLAATAVAQDHIPDCIIEGRPAPINNHQVLVWKNTTPNQFKARAHVEGIVTRIFPKTANHDHFEIQLDAGKKDTLEVIFNQSFGPLPVIRPGMRIEACGDYITSNARANGYNASPSNAIIHWIHENARGGSHEDGFVVVEGSLFGYFKPVDGGEARYAERRSSRSDRGRIERGNPTSRSREGRNDRGGNGSRRDERRGPA